MASTLFTIPSLRGGLDDTTPPIALADDSCAEAENVEFVRSMLGERRRGCVAITLPSQFTDVTKDSVVWLYRHLPDGEDQLSAEMWALADNLTTGSNVMMYRDATGWNTLTTIKDAIVTLNNLGHKLSAASLHGKLFIAYKSAVDRLHVWDKPITTLRRTGLAAASAAPTVANTGAGTYAANIRYYRVRFIEVRSSVTIRRSEPSDSVSFTPSGTGTAARVTMPTAPNESETHWELEASTDDANFYLLATVAIGTTTYDDSTTTTDYSDGELSEDIGSYDLIPSGKFLSADEDRLIIAGSWENEAEASRVRWTPVYGSPGVGNDERLDFNVDPFIDLDGYEGGGITGMSRPVNGYIYIFKRSAIYKLIRTNTRAKAYETQVITKAKGALEGSLVEAIHQSGRPSLFFLDPTVGPMRLSTSGLQWCGRDIQNLWQRVNVNATIPCHGVYYSNSRQLHYWLAMDDSEYPNFKIVLHVNEMRDDTEGARRGWVTVGLDNRIATALCSGMFSINTDSSDDRSYSLVPFIGKQTWTVGGNTIRDLIQRCDTGGKDADTTGDTESSYRATVKSKVFPVGGLLNQATILDGAVVLKKSDPDGMVSIDLIKNFGKESLRNDVSHYSEGDETHVIARLGDMGTSEVYTIQVAIGNLDTALAPTETYDVDLLQLKLSDAQKA